MGLLRQFVPMLSLFVLLSMPSQSIRFKSRLKQIRISFKYCSSPSIKHWIDGFLLRTFFTAPWISFNSYDFWLSGTMLEVARIDVILYSSSQANAWLKNLVDESSRSMEMPQVPCFIHSYSQNSSSGLSNLIIKRIVFKHKKLFYSIEIDIPFCTLGQKRCKFSLIGFNPSVFKPIVESQQLGCLATFVLKRDGHIPCIVQIPFCGGALHSLPSFCQLLQ